MSFRQHRFSPLVSPPHRGYATKHVVEGLEPQTLYQFRLKVTSPSGEHAYSPVVTVSTTSEYANTPSSPVWGHGGMTSRPEAEGTPFCSALLNTGAIPFLNAVTMLRTDGPGQRTGASHWASGIAELFLCQPCPVRTQLVPKGGHPP